MESRTVNPCEPVAPWLGSKRNLARVIIPRIEGIDHGAYAEPFVGQGGIFLRRRIVPRREFINDLSRDVANFFRILQRHYVAFLDHLRFQITTRQEFDRLVATEPETLTDIERAARFLYLQRVAFGGKVRNRTFGVSPQTPARFDLSKLGPLLEDVHARLSGVVIECLPYGRFIHQYDTPDTLFYLDPPYRGSENDYGKGMFSPADFGHLARLLGGIRGGFLMSINDHPDVRTAFAGFEIEEIETTYTVGTGTNGDGKRVRELLIYGGLAERRQSRLL